jgi:myo-inositol-1(or 4)-monophosphatase
MASETDYRVEREIRDFLSRRAPTVGFLGEEDGRTGATDAFWVLDPIDGTANFVRGIPLCAVSLALVQDTETMLGVIILPFIGETYCAEQDKGALLNGKEIHCSDTDKLAEAIVSIGDYAVGRNAGAKNQARFALTETLAAHVQRVRMLGTAAVDLAWVASGRLDATVALSNKPWDTAAGVLIAREAGAEVVDRDGSRHTLDSSATIAANAVLTPQVLALLAEIG